MKTSDIRAEVVELINSGMLNVPKIVSYFKTYRPEADLKKVREEAKELVAQVRETIRRGY
jgi:hypothetical protein